MLQPCDSRVSLTEEDGTWPCPRGDPIDPDPATLPLNTNPIAVLVP